MKAYINKQQIIDKFNEPLQIENYSEQTIKNYLSALKLFLEYISKLNAEKVSKNDLFYYKTQKNIRIQL
jgi:site-specific recombinase XerD